MTKMMKLVIARYNEDLDWVENLPSNLYSVVVYNKGEELKAPRNGENVEVVKLPNIGREQYTFYHHIYHNYDSLDDFTAFLQGGLMEHLLGTLYDPMRKQYFKTPQSKYPALMALRNHIKPQEFATLGHPVHSNNPFQSSQMTEYLMKARKILFPDLPESFQYFFGAGGMFIASKRVLHKYPRSFYKKILDMWDNSMGMHFHSGRDELVEDFLFEHFNSFMYTL